MGVISCRISVCYFPLPLVPSRQGRGKFTFYETILIVNGENPPLLSYPLYNDFCLECCILKEDTKNKITGRSRYGAISLLGLASAALSLPFHLRVYNLHHIPKLLFRGYPPLPPFSPVDLTPNPASLLTVIHIERRRDTPSHFLMLLDDRLKIH